MLDDIQKWQVTVDENLKAILHNKQYFTLGQIHNLSHENFYTGLLLKLYLYLTLYY